MTTPMAAAAVLNREFFEIRAKILEVAASLDRLDRGDGSTADDPRLKLLLEAIDLLQENKPDRAEQIQLLFSREYEDDWRETFKIPPTT